MKTFSIFGVPLQDDGNQTQTPQLMKKVFLLLSALLLAGVVSAQGHKKNILGVRAGLNVSSYSISESGVSIESDARAAYHIAVSDQILLSERLPFYLETGLAYTSRGGRLGNVSLRPSYLQIPVLVNYHIGIRNIVSIQPFAGLYYGLGIGGKIKERKSGAKGDAFGEDGMLKRSDLGVRLGVGATWRHYYFGLGYDFGCLNTFKEAEGGSSMRNNCFTISVGYNF